MPHQGRGTLDIEPLKKTSFDIGVPSGDIIEFIGNGGVQITPFRQDARTPAQIARIRDLQANSYLSELPATPPPTGGNLSQQVAINNHEISQSSTNDQYGNPEFGEFVNSPFALTTQNATPQQFSPLYQGFGRFINDQTFGGIENQFSRTIAEQAYGALHAPGEDDALEHLSELHPAFMGTDSIERRQGVGGYEVYQAAVYLDKHGGGNTVAGREAAREFAIAQRDRFHANREIGELQVTSAQTKTTRPRPFDEQQARVRQFRAQSVGRSQASDRAGLLDAGHVNRRRLTQNRFLKGSV